MDLHVERYGQGEKIVYIHGSGWNTRMWDAQREQLKSLVEIVLVDLPGHGESPGDGCESVDAYGDSVYGAIKGLGLGPYYVVGHSLGGAIAMSMALSHPEAVKGLVLIGTGAKLRVLPQILEGAIKDKERAVRHIMETAFSRAASPTLKDIGFEETMKCDSQVIYRDFLACDRFNIMDAVGSLKIPTLIICGIDDSLTPPKYSRYLNAAIQGSKLVLIEDAGHMVMMEKPEVVSRAIAEFIRGG